MPLGLCNTPATFQSIMNIVLSNEIGGSSYVYIDDIVVFSNSMDEHLSHLDKIFTFLNNANLIIKKSKCVFLSKQVKFLGHIISEHGIRTDPEKVAAVKE
ncbi:Retrovirus-related Pol polyprotein from transposon 17.6 [Thelohanellus kitauei]|uniref:Retrovirus-related Pol polyprotein from transposon 17.6 n=1 Tax=Thelohanellus kitauei TaxID=669202 RepID=A0A0C2JQN3_THEKT|nr:Retrovirus-related Pol polyprotein from transposon 17.6 [Thelohanellus kitauei]